MSPKLIRWVGGVRCLGLFPKKCRFFFTPSLSLLDQMFSTSQVDSDASVWSEKARKAIIAHDKEHMRSCLGKGGSAEKTKARKGKEDRVDIWHDSSSISDF